MYVPILSCPSTIWAVVMTHISAARRRRRMAVVAREQCWDNDNIIVALLLVMYGSVENPTS